MRFACIALLAAGCMSRDVSSDAALADAAPDAPFNESRQVTSVVVGPDRVAWTQTAEGCPLEGSNACPSVGPSVTTAELSSGTVVTWVADRFGSWNMVGDQDELFMGVGPSEFGGYIGRLRPWSGGGLEPVTTVLWWVSAPAVDGTNLYWFETAPNGAPMVLRRASRSGNGTDALTLATVEMYARQPTVFADYVWWTSDALYRVPVTGGTPEMILDRSNIAATTGDALYVTRGVEVTPTGPWETQIIRVAADGTSAILIDHLSQQQQPVQIVVDGDVMFWRALNQHLFRTTISTIDITEVPDAGFGVFGVTPDAILVDFTRQGYRSIPR